MKQSSEVRKPYSGSIRSLVLALDVGTTFSGVSYAILEPGEIPKIHGVTRFPGQEHVAGNCKIPSILYYNREGKVMAAGAEADTTSITSQAEEEDWIKAELFKLRLRPKAMKLNMNGMRLSQLPRNKTPVDVFGDFLNYLFRCTRNFIIDTHANGETLWRAVENGIEFVLSHPNGWEGAQQTKMRRAAMYGGLVPDTDEGRSRIRFVTEGEASLHSCVQSGLAADVLSNPSKHGFIVADAGGGTLDISSYAVRGTQPLVIEEIAPPDCIFAGSVFVSRRAREFFAGKLKNSKYGTADAIDHITKRFDETTKRLFRDKADIQWVPFGSPLDKDISVGIRGGSLKLTGQEVAELFEPSVEAAVASIKAQVEASQSMVKSVWLVGGFAASPWLFSQLQERLGPLNIRVSRPDSQTSKAVADGALGFYCDHHVSARVSRFMYGVEYLREYDPNDTEHVARKERLCELPSGPRLLPDAFDCILSRGVKVKESTVFTRKYCTELTSLSTLSVFEVEIWCYRGGDTIPLWIHRHAEDFSTLCVVRADLSPLSSSAEPKTGKNGKTYWTIVFSVEIHFGLTEFKARIKWNDNGQIKYGPASIVYSESGHRTDEDEQDTCSEDDIGPSRSASRSVSRSASVAPSMANSQDSVGSGAKTPLGVARQEQTFLDVPDRNRLASTTSQANTSFKGAASSSASVYSERVREIERERTISSTSRITTSISSKTASSATKVSSSTSVLEEKRGRESDWKLKEKERQEREKRERELEQQREQERQERERELREKKAQEEQKEKGRREKKAREQEQKEREARERKAREQEQKEREEKERLEREQWEKEEKERLEHEQREREEKERLEHEQWEREEKERKEHEQWEREECKRREREKQELEEKAEMERKAREEREQKEREEKERREKPKEKDKRKTPRGSSKFPSSPVDLADSAVGKSPARLGETLTSVWGSQSKAVTPAASPLPPSRSVGPNTPKANYLSVDIHSLGSGNADAKSTLLPSVTLSKDLSLEVPQSQGVGSGEAWGYTPADTLPPEQFLTVGASQEVATIPEVNEQSSEPSAAEQVVETTGQGSSNLFQLSLDTQGAGSGQFDSWGIDMGSGAATSTKAEEWTEISSNKIVETTTSYKSPFSWGRMKRLSGLPSASSFGAGLNGALGGLGNYLGAGDPVNEGTNLLETMGEVQGDLPIADITAELDKDISNGPIADAANGMTSDLSNGVAADPSATTSGPPADETGAAAEPVEEVAVDEKVDAPVTRPGPEAGEVQDTKLDEVAEGAGGDAGDEGQAGGDEEAEDDYVPTKAKKVKASQMKHTESGGGGGGSSKKKKKKK